MHPGKRYFNVKKNKKKTKENLTPQKHNHSWKILQQIMLAGYRVKIVTCTPEALR